MEWDFYLFAKTAGIAIVIFAGGVSVAKYLSISRTKAYLINTVAVFVGYASSRLWYIVQHIYGREAYEYRSLAKIGEAWSEAGSVLYGWVLGGAVAVILLTRLFKIRTIQYLDRLAPWLLVAQFLNRLGCLDAGCCFGKEISRKFIMLQTPELQKALMDLGTHPVQLYEAIYDLLLLFVIKVNAKRQGEATFLYFAGYATGRFFLEFLRGDNQPTSLFMTVPQVTSILILTSVLLLRKRILSQAS